jgi:hypothetical protein
MIYNDRWNDLVLSRPCFAHDKARTERRQLTINHLTGLEARNSAKTMVIKFGGKYLASFICFVQLDRNRTVSRRWPTAVPCCLSDG